MTKPPKKPLVATTIRRPPPRSKLDVLYRNYEEDLILFGADGAEKAGEIFRKALLELQAEENRERPV